MGLKPEGLIEGGGGGVKQQFTVLCLWKIYMKSVNLSSLFPGWALGSAVKPGQNLCVFAQRGSGGRKGGNVYNVVPEMINTLSPHHGKFSVTMPLWYINTNTVWMFDDSFPQTLLEFQERKIHLFCTAKCWSLWSTCTYLYTVLLYDYHFCITLDVWLASTQVYQKHIGLCCYLLFPVLIFFLN